MQDMNQSRQDVPLFVDLDGSLIKTNSLHEAAIILARMKPWLVFLLPLWLLRGQDFLWNKLAETVSINVGLLPYRPEVLEYLRDQRDQGREIILISGAHETIVSQVSRHLGLFSSHHGSTSGMHLVADRKLQVIRERIGDDHFDYLGDSRRDLVVWGECRKAIVVSDDKRFVDSVKRLVDDVAAIEPQSGGRIYSLIKALRPHQWAKNLLLFAAVMLGHKFTDPGLVKASLVAFIAFSLCGSAVYIMNDLADLDADRQHSRKRSRPFAAGEVSAVTGVIMSALLLLAAFLVASTLQYGFIAVLGLYFILTFLYSFYLKKKVLIDVLLLGGLYTIRVWAGGTATGIIISQWALAFFMCLFFSIALAKRYSELHSNLDQATREIQNRRGYLSSDLQFLMSLGCSSALLAVLVIALYLNSQDVIRYYRHPSMLWLVCPVFAYWLSRLWLITARGELDEDPVLFAIRDRMSYLAGALMLIIFALAI